MLKTIRNRCLASTFVTAIALSGGVVGQANATQDQAAADDDNVDEIIVTAGRRQQSLQDVPASVVAISPEDFTLKGLQQIKDVISYLPGIQYTESGSPGRGTISARGVPQSSATPVFGIYVDDTPLTSNTNFSNGANTLLDGLLLDVERVEIIRPDSQ